MGKNTAITWTDHSWNPWQGCHKVSTACDNCYMYREKKRYGQDPGTVVRSSNKTFNQPLRWWEPAKVFTCSWSDFFIEEADEWRFWAWYIIMKTPHLTYQILTKRPERIKDCLPKDWGNGWPNVWLGVTAENQEMADLRVPILLQIPAAVRFVSVEPMLGPVDLDSYLVVGADYPWSIMCKGIDWVICGGESGPRARPMHPDWVRSLRAQCQVVGVPFFFKQWGEWKGNYPGDNWKPTNDMKFYYFDTPGYLGKVWKCGTKAAGHLLDAQEWRQFPEGSR